MRGADAKRRVRIYVLPAQVDRIAPIATSQLGYEMKAPDMSVERESR